ncbi:MAG: insulinase family protein [Clostridia bacterium]|nr:insulinase family protein [Clostridia bacterium]
MEKEFVSERGVKIYSYKNPASHGFFISLFLRAGSIYENESNLGITHFLEHVAIRNINYNMSGELYRELDRFGLDFNAYTSSDLVQFYISGASANFSKGAELISKLLQPITLPASDIAAERRRIKAEIRESDDKGSLANFTNGIVFSGSPLKNSILGTNKTVDKIGRARLEEYRCEVFLPGKMFFYVTGNFEESDILSLASLIDAAYPSGAVATLDECDVSLVPDGFCKRAGGVYIKNADFTMLKFTFDIPPDALCAPECDIIYDMLLSGYNSRLFIEMSEKRGLFYDITGSLDRYADMGSFAFSFELKEKDIYLATELIVSILKSFSRENIAEEDIIRAGYTDNAYMLFDDIREFNYTYAYDNHILRRGYRSIEDRVAAYKAVTPASIRAVAERIFQSENLTLTAKGKKKKIDIKRLSEIISSL